MKTLKTISERAKKISGIKDLIHREVGGFEKARSKKEIHASDLTKEVEYCPREVFLMEQHKKKQRDQWLPTALRITFDEGNYKQWILNNRYLDQHMVGPWRCSVCNTVETWSVGRPGKNCVNCDAGPHAFEYEEPFFKDPVSEAQGSIDGLVVLPNEDKLRVLELKTASESVYVPLKAPLAEHRLRTAFYLALIERSDHPRRSTINTDQASVVYWLRGYGKKCQTSGEITPFKEFVVKRNDDLIEPLFEKAASLTVARGGGAIPPQICPHQLCTRAKKCRVAKECFSVGIPSQD